MNKISMITGVTGQDGSYLSELLLDKGYFVVGLKRRTSLINTSRIDHLYDNPNFKLEYYDLNDTGRIWELFSFYKPNEIYNLACQSHVKVSFETSENTVDGIVLGTLRILNAMKSIVPNAKFYQASSSEMFGDNPNMPITGFTELDRFVPASPYACAKVFSHNIVSNYRKSYNLHCSSGILFNHCSIRRGETFVTRKISTGVAKIKLGLQDYITLGNLDAKRDWGHAPNFVEAMWRMLQQEYPDDYVIATGETHTVREFLELTFKHAGIDNYEKYVKINSKYFRPQEVPILLGDYSKARAKLGWKPKTKFKELVKLMYEHDYDRLKKGE